MPKMQGDGYYGHAGLRSAGSHSYRVTIKSQTIYNMIILFEGNYLSNNLALFWKKQYERLRSPDVTKFFSDSSEPLLCFAVTKWRTREPSFVCYQRMDIRLEGILNFGLRKVHALGCMADSRRVVIGHSSGLAIIEIDHEEQVSTDSSENAL